MKRIEERLNTKPITRGEHCAVYAIPEHYCEFAPQPVQAVSAEILIEMKRNLAVRTGPKPMPGLFEFLLNRLITVEFAIDDDPKRFVFVGDWLISSRKVDNAQACVPETDSIVGCDPVALPIGAPMTQTPCRFLQQLGTNRAMLRKHGNNSAHVYCLSMQAVVCSIGTHE